MTEKLTPEQLKAVFDLSDTSDVTDADRAVMRNFTRASAGPFTTRLLKHYHPELFVDPRLEAAKKLAREILAEEYEKIGSFSVSRDTREGSRDATVPMEATLRALLTDIQVGEN